MPRHSGRLHIFHLTQKIHLESSWDNFSFVKKNFFFLSKLASLYRTSIIPNKTSVLLLNWIQNRAFIIIKAFGIFRDEFTSWNIIENVHAFSNFIGMLYHNLTAVCHLVIHSTLIPVKQSLRFQFLSYPKPSSVRRSWCRSFLMISTSWFLDSEFTYFYFLVVVVSRFRQSYTFCKIGMPMTQFNFFDNTMNV